MYAVLDASLITGNETIDGQHAELIEKINNLVKVCENATGKAEAIRMLDYLMEYTDFHFTAEEELQKSVNYPALPEHEKKHAEFKHAVAELEEMLQEEEGPTDAFVAAVNKNVIDWLYDHIKGFDRAVAEYISANA